jgi:hypothetical protein
MPSRQADKKASTTASASASKIQNPAKSRVFQQPARGALPGLEVRRLIDRDDQSDAEVDAARKRGDLVLTRRNLESYLFGDELLRLLAESCGKAQLAGELIKARDTAISAKNGRVDNFKQVAGETYVACKKVLGLTASGNNTKTFMRDTLSPLITENTETFKQLRRDIFG